MNCNDELKAVGSIDVSLEYKNGKKVKMATSNTILTIGRTMVVNLLIGDTGSYPSYFINRMTFGDNGLDGGSAPKIVTPNRTGLFGPVVATKSAVSTANPDNLTQAIFTSVLAYGDANGSMLSEMALLFNTGDYYSMVTFPGISKTSDMQITFNWAISLI